VHPWRHEPFDPHCPSLVVAQLDRRAAATIFGSFDVGAARETGRPQVFQRHTPQAR
jgi:hypothetical protein